MKAALQSVEAYENLAYSIKHHRIPAPELSFDQPNLQFLVEEIVKTLLK
jgi:hypothetical protein